MRSKLIATNGGQRTFALVFDIGDEVMRKLAEFAASEQLSAAQLSAIGAFSDAVLGYFEWDRKEFRRIEVGEQVEVASLSGDVALATGGERSVHIHAVLGRKDGSALAGHLIEAHVRPTLEVILTESPAHLQKVHDAETGLALIRIDD